MNIQLLSEAIESIKVHNFKHGDIIIIKSKDTLSEFQKESIQTQLASIFPDNKIMILCGLNLEIMSKS